MGLHILAGNGLAAIGNLFTVASSWTRDYKKIYLFQAVQCLMLALANVFFGSFSGVTTLVLCGIRNYLTAYHKFTVKVCAAVLILIVAAGLLANTRGIVGLIPIATSVLYTIGCYLAKKTFAIKCNMIMNLTLWGIYDFCILDFVSGTVDSVSALVAVASAYRASKEGKEQKDAE